MVKPEMVVLNSPGLNPVPGVPLPFVEVVASEGKN